MIPLAVPNLSGNEKKYLNECIDTEFVSSVGPFVTRFEEFVATSSEHLGAVATSSGTSGLHVALVSVGVKQGDLVLVPALTFIATANAVVHAGAIPWFIDVDCASWTLDPNALESALSQGTRIGVDGFPIHLATGKRVSAIIPVYTLGTPADMDHIVSIAGRYSIPVVADAAAALGATYKDRALGHIGASLSVFSFNGNKTVTAGGGGAVAGNDSDLLRYIRHLTSTARTGVDYDHDHVGFNYRMTNLQAAVGCAQMEQLAKFVKRKREIAAFYRDNFEELSQISHFPSPAYCRSACWFSGFVLESGNPTNLRLSLREAGIDARPFWKPLHLQLPYLQSPRMDLSISEGIWQRIITLPCSSSITNEELSDVASLVREKILSGLS